MDTTPKLLILLIILIILYFLGVFDGACTVHHKTPPAPTHPTTKIP